MTMTNRVGRNGLEWYSTAWARGAARGGTAKRTTTDQISMIDKPNTSNDRSTCPAHGRSNSKTLFLCSLRKNFPHDSRTVCSSPHHPHLSMSSSTTFRVVVTPLDVHPFHRIRYLRMDFDPPERRNPPTEFSPAGAEMDPPFEPFMSTHFSEGGTDLESQPLPTDGVFVLGAR